MIGRLGREGKGGVAQQKEEEGGLFLFFLVYLESKQG